MRAKYIECKVCGGENVENEAHFGVKTCRACAAFFRRTVANGKTYRCRRNGSCPVNSTVRCMCRACRFAKCLSVGMRKEVVQKYRDVYGKRDPEEDAEESASSSSPAVSQSNGMEDVMPILTLLHNNYTLLENVRRIFHQTHSEKSVFKTRPPKAVTYKEGCRINSKECDLIADCMLNTFPKLEQLTKDQKTILFRNFFLQFIVLQNSYIACVNKRFEIIILANGDYIDCEHPETFYYDPDGDQKMSPEDAARMFSSSFITYRRNVTEPLHLADVDKHEFIALASLALFDIGLDGQNDESVDVCRHYRDAIQRELLFYYQNKKNVIDSPIRLANLISILPGLQRAARRFQEDVEISNVFNVCAVDEKFYEICHGRL